jgi:hypothetical protein
LHLGQPCHGASEIDKGLERGERLFETQGDLAEAFDLGKEN